MDKKVTRVVAALIRKDNKIFAAKRSYGFLKGKWELPGGKIEDGETPKDALLREIKEELSIEIEITSFFCNIKYEYPDFMLDMDVFNSKVINGRLLLHENIHCEEAFLDIDKLNYDEWCPADIEILKKL